MDFWKSHVKKFEIVKIEKSSFLKKYCTQSKKLRKQTPPKPPKKLTWLTEPGRFDHFEGSYGHFSKLLNLLNIIAGRKKPSRLFFCKSILFCFFQPKNQILCIQACNIKVFDIKNLHWDDCIKQRHKEGLNWARALCAPPPDIRETQ